MIPYAALVLVVVAISAALLTAGAARALVHRERDAELESIGRVFDAGSSDAPAAHRIRHFLIERFSMRTALGLQLTIAVVICVAALAFFGEVADNIIDRDELARFDGRVAALVAPHRTTSHLALANWVSHLGTIPVMALLAAIIIATLFRREWRAIAVGWIFLVSGGELVEQILKRTFRRDRPPNIEQWLVAGGFSFPSGHSMGAIVGYGLMTYLLLMRVRRPLPRVVVIMCGVAIVAAIGLSRLVLGVHFFTDVIGGYAAGAVWISMSIAVVEIERSRWRLRHRPADAPARAPDGATARG